MFYTTLAQSTADWALSKVGCAYSQARRTEEDIFECSSLIVRPTPRKANAGSTAAACLRATRRSTTMISSCPSLPSTPGSARTSVVNMAKQPGDLQFLCTDSGTSRLSKITHVTMVASPTQIVHARGTKYGVCTNSISLYAGKVFALAFFHIAETKVRKIMQKVQ